ncbi:right-handed parallel beta-helix repeat-containing protein [bacterium]|nr:right-handed parallel beta-helix repeat-containing protein [bacterium]
MFRKILFILLILSGITQAEILNVPDDFETIQGAIDAAEAGDTVLVQPGIYEENISAADKGDLTIGSLTLTTDNPAYIDSTIIDGGGEGIAVGLNRMQRDANIVFRGFTVRNGNEDWGGGISVSGAIDAELSDLIVTENQGRNYAVSAQSITDVQFARVKITENASGGICVFATHASLEDCDISNNQNDGGFMAAGILTMDRVSFIENAGYGLRLDYGWRTPYALNHLTIAGTRMVDDDDGIGLAIYTGEENDQVHVDLKNSIIFDNEGVSILLYEGSTTETELIVSYSDVEGGQDAVEFEGDGEAELHWNDGNISEDPLFVNPDVGDYHLTEDSPCIDTGDPEADPDPDETRADMGAYFYDQRHVPGILLVPQDFETIQEAINASEDGDTVLVSPGTYVENISFEGKGIIVASLILTTGDRAYIDSTIIDGNEADCVVCFANEEDSTSVLQGFTILNGIQDFGGGIDCQRYTSPILIDLVVTENTARRGGGGIYFTGQAEPVIKRTIITGNSCGTGGGGIGSWLPAHAYLEDVVITGNTSDDLGGGLYGESNGSYTLDNVLIFGNTAVYGGGVFFYGSVDNVFNNVTISGNQAEGWGGIVLGTYEGSGGSTLDLINSIIWGNSGTQIRHYAASENEYLLDVSYCDIEGGEDGISLGGDAELQYGDGNIDEDPQFVDSDNGDYHLTEDSPCIDTGDPDSPLDPDGTRADMGAYPYYQNHIIIVPDDYETIQAAIDASQDGDTVLVNPGMYVENINFNGKNIIVASLFLTTEDEAYIDSTVIDGDQNGAVVEIFERVTAEAKLTGFTIQNGSGKSFGFGNLMGGGIFILQSDIVIEHCMVCDNYVTDEFGDPYGGGIICYGYNENSSPTIRDCEIFSNTSEGSGGGIAIVAGCNPVIENCVIEENAADYSGGGIFIYEDCNPVISNCQILDNISASTGGGITVIGNSSPVFSNCLLEDNETENDRGAAIACIHNGNPLIVNCTFDWEPRYGWYTAIYLSSAQARIINSNLWGLSPLWITYDPNAVASSIMIAYSDVMDGQESIVTNDNGEVHWEDGNIDSDPIYIDREDGDYNVAEDSPCIDIGTSFFVWEDDTLVNMSEDEYMGNAPDMGAYESDFSSAVEDKLAVPTEFKLYQNYPNPFNPTTSLRFDLPIAGNACLKIYDINGREITMIADGAYNAGRYTAVWDARNLPSGIYLAKLETAEATKVVKLMLIR